MECEATLAKVNEARLQSLQEEHHLEQALGAQRAQSGRLKTDYDRAYRDYEDAMLKLADQDQRRQDFMVAHRSKEHLNVHCEEEEKEDSEEDSA